MNIKLTPEIEKFLEESKNLKQDEKELLIWAILQNYADKTSSIKQVEINDIIAYFFIPKNQKNTNSETSKNERKFGLWKDKIGFISPDFNEPVSDLSEYM